jgi:hypothetical protein
MFARCFDRLYYEGNQEVSLYCEFFFGGGGFWKEHVTAGGETWQEVITQVMEVAWTFEFSFLYALFRALIIVSALTKPYIW